MGAARSSRRAFDNLAEAFRARNGWTLSFVGEDQPDKLAALVEDLKRGFSESGDGKRFASGFAYWGVAPTVAWTKACNDPYYRVMRESTRRFSDSWDRLAAKLPEQPYHYVSLGVGTGEKDHHVLSRLTQRGKDTFFLPVDMSAAMLRAGVQRATGGTGIDRSRVLPVELDFSRDENVEELRAILDLLFGEQSILFSLLGNTAANFENDRQLLSLLASLLRPQDRFLLELATTSALTQAAADEAAAEYGQSDGFRQFALSALLHNTDLRVDRRHAGLFVGEVEEGRAVRVKVLHRNSGPDDQTFSLPDGHEVDFLQNDTVRLYLSRKYSKEGLGGLIASAGLKLVSDQNFLLHGGAAAAQFGVSLMLLEAAPTIPETTPPPEWDVFIAHAGQDSAQAEELYVALQSKCSVYLDRRVLLPGDDWDRLGKAQGASLITVVLISEHTDSAYYQREEIQAGLHMARTDSETHRVVPVYLRGRPSDSRQTPYGLWLKHSLEWPEEGGAEAIAEKLLSLLIQLKAQLERRPTSR